MDEYDPIEILIYVLIFVVSMMVMNHLKKEGIL